jgi:hypothetical protein
MLGATGKNLIMRSVVGFIIVCYFLQACRGPNTYPDSSNNKSNKDTVSNIGQVHDNKINSTHDSNGIDNFYPFVAYNETLYIDNDSLFLVSAEINLKQSDEYNAIFVGNGYTNTGYSWEGHVKQILKKENPSLFRHVKSFESLTNNLYVYTDSKQAQRQIAGLLSRVFKNHDRLDHYIMTADKSKIDRLAFQDQF